MLSSKKELAGYLTEASAPDCNVRVFWKLGADFAFGDCNEQFARDAGIPRAELIGLTDFDRRLPWRMQAAKYRADDQKIADSGEANLDIVERQGLRAAGLHGPTQARRPSGRAMERSSASSAYTSFLMQKRGRNSPVSTC